MQPFLETERLYLKLLEPTDFDNLYMLRSDPIVMQYGGIQTEEEVMELLTIAIQYQQKHNMGFCAAFEKETGNFIGQAGIFHLGLDDSKSDIEIGYRFQQQYWGKGYATEIAHALIQWGFENLSVEKLVGVVHFDNVVSRHVLEKIGLAHTGTIIYRGTEVNYFEIYRSDCVELLPYDLRWPALAAQEIHILHNTLPNEHIIDIQHVGSTAIPGMVAKPIIDIQIAVHSLSDIKSIAIETLKQQDYIYWAENPDPTRMFFVKGMPPFGKQRTHHVHIVEPTSKHWHGKMLFRDYLITHPLAAEEYKNLKQQLAQQYTYDREKYTTAKTQFVEGILEKSKSL